MSERTVTVRVPAKVNVQLSVGDSGPDGYHDLVTVFQAVSLYDEIVATEAAPGTGIQVTVSGEGAAELETGETNLAYRAAEAWADANDRTADVLLDLRKAIPVAGGMAGGSADAAATLVACDALWQTRGSRRELLRVAATLGADVPFALVGGTAVGTGRGDELSPALALGECHWVFALAEGGLSTPAVFAELDRLREGSMRPEPVVSDRLMQALRAGDARAIGRELVNELEPAALSLRPALRRTLDAGREFGALGAVISGSGPTAAFLAKDAEHALDLAISLAASGVCRTVKRAHGPVPGARVVED